MAEPLNHFTDVGDCSREQLEQLLDLALSISRDIRAFENTRTGRMLVNLFYEASTRTRVSFEAAAKRLGMHVINVSATGSSVEKGESLEDTFDRFFVREAAFRICAADPHCVELAIGAARTPPPKPETGKPPDVNTVRAICPAGYQPMEKDDVVGHRPLEDQPVRGQDRLAEDLGQ